MAKGYEPAGVQIAALQGKKVGAVMDLMRPGDGTPWEDRGARGGVVAFFQTCFKSITSPALLLDHIRRPDSGDEATQFAGGCAAMWALSAVVHGALLLNFVYTDEAGYAVTGSTFMIVSAVVGVVAAALAYFLLVRLASRTYFGLIATELKNTAPRVLIHNLFCYCLGPSILAPLPLVGPPLALLFIYIAWCVAGARRLFVSWRGAIVAASLSLVLVLVIAGVAAFFVRMIATGALDLQPTSPEGADPKKPRMVK